MCFPWASIFPILIWVVVICAVVAIVRVLLGWLGPKLGFAAEIIGVLAQIFMIILWAVIAIAVIAIVGEAVGCLISMAPSIGHIGR